MRLTPTQLSVVHVLAPARFGGLESVVGTLAAGQAAGGDAVCVAAVLSEGADQDHPFVDSIRRKGIEAEVWSIGARQYIQERRQLAALLRRRRAHVLHTHGYRPDVVDAPVARRLGIAAVTTVHGYTGGGWRNRFYEWLQTRSYRRSDAVIAVSEKLRRDLTSRGVDQERVYTVPNAFGGRVASFDRSDARRALGLPANGPVVGWVGRLSREKAPDVAIRVLADMDGLKPSLSLVGTGPMDAAVADLCAALGVADRVRLHGFVPDAGALLAAFDALLITSWTEGTPVTLLEAMAAGVPVVATSVGGIPDVVSVDEAWLAPAGDVKALARGLQSVATDPEAAAARAAAARRRLATSFAVGPWVERHREIYHAVIAGRAAGGEGAWDLSRAG